MPLSLSRSVSLLVSVSVYFDYIHLCCPEQVDQEYYDGLSISSKRSLAVQGGPFTATEAEEFIEREGAQDAVTLRLWDDRAKQKGKETPSLEYFKPYVMKCLAEPLGR